MAIAAIAGMAIVAGVLLTWRAARGTMPDFSACQDLAVTSPSLREGVIPAAYTGDGADKSPELVFEGLSAAAVSIAVIMDDLDVPVVGVYNHWTIWNISPREAIPEGVPHGNPVVELGNAVQGAGYGRHHYRGPKPPFGSHRYRFHVFVLDRMLDLDARCGKKELLDAVQGHILQYGSVTGRYPG